MQDDRLRRDFRPDIQGLRAVAVLLVVAYHLYPNGVTGGFVGVDVFFVISGYLITSHLHREVTSTGQLSLTRFWARRVRRLLPASLLVLFVCTLATWEWVPRTMWDQTLRQIAASAVYVQNWVLAGDAVDYLALGESPTLVQHYWSLSVEEQFYLLWPLLVAAGLYAARWSRLQVRPVLVATITLVGVASFLYSVTETADDAARAYFVTPVRVWEFAAGALLALLSAEGRASARAERSRGSATVLGWAGLAALVWSALALSSETPFPGWTVAIPVLGTAALIETGSRRAAVAPSRMLGIRPLRFLGDISYAIYLWHWPMIVVLPYITGVDLRTRDKLAILVATILVSWVTTRWFEDPLRTGRFLTQTPWRTYAAGATGMVLVLLLTSNLATDLDRDVEQAQVASAEAVDEALEEDLPCVGPAALDADRPASCGGTVAGQGALMLDPAAVAQESRQIPFPKCLGNPGDADVATCDLGTTGKPKRTVAVVGDSHAAHWLLALDEIGKERGWRVRTFARSGCAFSEARPVRANWPERFGPLCWDGNEKVEQALLADRTIRTVFVSADSSSYRWTQPSGGHLADPATDGFHALWKRLTAAGKQVVVIRDVPETKGDRSSPNCLAQHADDPVACATSREEGLARDVEADAVTGAPNGVRLIDLSGQFCDDQQCYARIGSVIVYRDHGHLSNEYSKLLAPYLARAFDAVDAPVAPSG